MVLKKFKKRVSKSLKRFTLSQKNKAELAIEEMVFLCNAYKSITKKRIYAALAMEAIAKEIKDLSENDLKLLQYNCMELKPPFKKPEPVTEKELTLLVVQARLKELAN